MTFCIALGNADQIIQASDRRVTTPSGKVVNDITNKVGHFICDDVSALYCFTGIAQVSPSRKTSEWILETLKVAAASGKTYIQIVEGFTAEADRYFKNSKFLQKLPPDVRRLTVMLTGYTIDGRIINCLISNFQDFVNFINHDFALPNFSSHREISKLNFINPTVVQVIGQFNSLISKDESSLRKLLERRAPAETIRQAAIGLIHQIADRPSSRKTVGKSINTARLDIINPITTTAGYLPTRIEHSIPLVDRIDVRDGLESPIFSNVKFEGSGPVVYPRVHRHDRCPCGSGKVYWNCHHPRMRKRRAV